MEPAGSADARAPRCLPPRSRLAEGGRPAVAAGRTSRPGVPAIAHHPRPSRAPTGSDALNAAIARTTPAVLALLADGVPRNKRAILAALADRHPKDEVKRTLMRLAVTDRLAEHGGKFTLPRVDEPEAEG